MYGIKRNGLFLRAYIEPESSPLWREFDKCRGNIYVKETVKLVTPRFNKLKAFYQPSQIEIYTFSERELEEIIILKLKG